MYTVVIPSTGKQYKASIFDNYAHVVDGQGVRYKVNSKTNQVYKFTINEIYVNTFDFSTPYNIVIMKNNLLVNLKQYIMNEIATSILASKLSATGTIAIQPTNSPSSRSLSLYLDLFNDLQSRDNYCLAQQKDADSSEVVKFSEVYKNNLREIDDSAMFGGNLYNHLQGLVSRVFGSGSTVMMVDKPSICVTRSNSVDKFTYTAYFDIDVRLDKGKYGDVIASTNKTNWVVGHATINGVKCTVEMSPKFNGASSAMTYDVTYKIVGATYSCTYD